MLSQYKPGEQAVLEANPEYNGERDVQGVAGVREVLQRPRTAQAPTSRTAQVDVAWRTLSPTDLTSLEDGGKVEVLHGKGSEFRYWVWQFNNDVAKDKATRQAAAQIIDRDAIAANAYDGTVAPAYSIVPPGFGGQKDSFTEKYGEPERRRREADPRRRRHQDPGRHHPGLHADPLRPERRGRGQPSSPTSSPAAACSTSRSRTRSGRSTRRSTRRAPTTCSSSAGTPTSWTRTTT